METKKTTKTVKKTTKSISTTPKIVKSVKASFLDVPVYDITGKALKTITLSKEVFDVEAKPQLLAQYVRVYMTNARQGNAATKTRGEVSGSTRKLFRQKGTGRARHGSKKAPIFVGGGVSGGPQPRDFSLKINKKQKRKAFLGALTLKAKDHAVSVLSNKFMTMEPKTKSMSGFLKNSGNDHGSTLIIFPKMEKNNLMLAARNIPNIELTTAQSLNAYDVLKHKKLLFVEDALPFLASSDTKTS